MFCSTTRVTQTSFFESRDQVRVRTVVEFDRAQQQVWDALQDVAEHPMTGKMMKPVETLPSVDGRPVWKEDMGHGEIITVTPLTFDAPRQMSRKMSSGSVNMISEWNYVLESVDEGCNVTIAGVTDIERGTWHTPLFRVMMALGDGVKKGLDTQLDMVASTLGATARRAS